MRTSYRYLAVSRTGVLVTHSGYLCARNRAHALEQAHVEYPAADWIVSINARRGA